MHRWFIFLVLNPYLSVTSLSFNAETAKGPSGGGAQAVLSIPRYAFKEYSYVALPKYETHFQEFQSACQLNPSCQRLEGVDQLNCVRECISPSCYIELYQNDKLEAGEVDVRLDSFKGCFIQRGLRRI